MDALAARGHPCIVTEVFSLDQLIDVCERHAVAIGNGPRPPLFISPITGILGDHLRVVAREQGIEVDPAVISRAGIILARACRRVVAERGYPVTLLAGGARTTFDLTDLVGGGMHATINYSTVEELDVLDPPVAETIDTPDDPAVVDALQAAFDTMRRALEPGAIAAEEFATLPPVLYFQQVFADGWATTIDTIASERASIAIEPAPGEIVEA